MGIFQKAVETYDQNARFVGVEREGYQTLAPISHIVQNAAFEIAIDADGRFVSASAVAKEDAKTIIPATEESAGRAGKVIRPHPLSDQLCFLAPMDKEKNAPYLEQIEKWARSAHGHPKVGAVLRYIRGGTILGDLAGAGLIASTPEAPLGKDEKSLVRFRVLGAGEPAECWRDRSLFDAFAAYYADERAEIPSELCMITGGEEAPTENHPKGVVASSYGAKLISANDDTNFTYRGRFTASRQAATVGYTASQKAHSALRWVAANSGAMIGGRTFACWNPQGKRVMQPTGPFGIAEAERASTPSDYKARLASTLLGYRNEFAGGEDVIVAAFDAATTGRLSLTYYSEQRANDFWDRIEKWYSSCCFYFGKFGIQSPSIKNIAKCAFGAQRGSFIECDDKPLGEHTQMLLPCVTEGAPIPADVARALFSRSTQPLAYKGGSREELICTAAAVIRKYRNDILKREEYKLELEPNKRDRSYQYGRLLAVLEKAERDTYDSGEEREPNAVRMWSTYCERPLYASRVIIEQLKKAYLPRLSPGIRSYYDRLIGEIFAEIGESDAEGRLGDSYILGYYLQRRALYTKRGGATEDEITEEFEEEAK